MLASVTEYPSSLGKAPASAQNVSNNSAID